MVLDGMRIAFVPRVPRLDCRQSIMPDLRAFAVLVEEDSGVPRAHRRFSAGDIMNVVILDPRAANRTERVDACTVGKHFHDVRTVIAEDVIAGRAIRSRVPGPANGNAGVAEV